MPELIPPATTTECTIKDIRFCEPAETQYTVNPDGQREKELETYATDEISPHPYTCVYHGLDFTDWDEVMAHLKGNNHG